MKRSSSRYTYTTTSKWTEFHKKNKSFSAYCSVVYAVVAVDTKVTNASLTQNQCLQCGTPP